MEELGAAVGELPQRQPAAAADAARLRCVARVAFATLVLAVVSSLPLA
ncbi:MAG: hypothetical protein ACK5IH_14960 [Betaproteobacteria bacterium]